jgi:hypothetical protein
MFPLGFLAVDVFFLKFCGFVDSVPLDDLMQIGHQADDPLSDSLYFLHLLNIDIIEQSDLLFK